MADTKVLPCHCQSKYQDSRYGQGQRLHNYARKANKGLGGHRCTVCGNTK